MPKRSNMPVRFMTDENDKIIGLEGVDGAVIRIVSGAGANTVLAGAAPLRISLQEGMAVNIVGAAGATGTVSVFSADGLSVTNTSIAAGSSPQIGPFIGTRTVVVTSTAGSISANVVTASVPSAALNAVTSIVSDIRAAYDAAALRNPFTLGVMTTAPVVTNPTGSSLPVVYAYAAGTNSRYFNVSGATLAAPQFIDTSFGGYLRIRGARIAASTYASGPTWTLSWTAICSSMDISVLASSLPYRLQVDGAWVTAAGVTTASNATINFNFAAAGGNKKRVFTLEMSQDQGLSEVRLGNNDTLYASPSNSPTVLIMGDSYTDGTLSPSGMSGNSFPGVMRAMLGCNVIAQGLGGTGYVVPGGSFPLTNSIRLDDAAAVNPDAIIIAMGTNDFSQPGISAAVITVLRGLRARRPNTPIIVFGPWGQALNLSAPVLQAEADILTGFNAASDSLMRFIPMNTASLSTTPWTTGTGNTGAVTASGNSSVMIGPDGVHPSAAIGGIYYGQRMALEAVKALLTMTKQ